MVRGADPQQRMHRQLPCHNPWAMDIIPSSELEGHQRNNRLDQTLV